MFPPDLLTALGSLTIRFAELDEAVTDFVSDLLRCEEFEVAWKLIAPMDFSRKVQKGAELVQYYAEKFAIEKEPAIVASVDIFKKTESISNRRNNIIHSHVHFSLDGSEHVFKHHKKGTIDASEHAVTQLVKEADDAITRCRECWIGLRRLLDTKYDQLAGRDNPSDDIPGGILLDLPKE